MTPDHKQTRLLHWLLPFVCSIVLVMMTPDTLAETAASGKMLSPPPSVELQYTVRVKITAMSIGGRSIIQWENKGNEYLIQTSARGNALGQVLESSSKGEIGSDALKPSLFKEKRIGKDETTVTFDRNHNTLLFSESDKTIPLEDNIQDRASIVWQLASAARANPEKFAPGSTFTLKVVGRNKIDLWDFTILDEETLQTALGDINTIHIRRQDKKGKTTEVWLAPDMHWYPLRLIFDDNRNFRLEQVIKNIAQK
ncbi:DUF3108 domain-containing protein [Oxalobacter sp. OttesenSCG-928-P03]|nr:DUF3108 domain-containing protein [Oxalobacter sp. OttesenSCG-928-P03]